VASFRLERVAEEIRKVVSERLVRGLKVDLPAFVTISHVEVSKDMSIAKVYYSLFGEELQCAATQAALIEQKSALRYEVGKKVRLRHTPDLVFIRDNSPERAARIQQLLNDSKPAAENEEK
jgi:ribosome-binding factor A